MHYFIHGPNIAAVEDAGQAAKYASAGWRPVSCAVFIAAWRLRDARDRAALPLQRERVEPVPSDVPPNTVLERMSGGRARFKG